MTKNAAAMSALKNSPEMLRIEPARGWFHLNWNEFWEYRELLVLLAKRDLKASYAQTMLGASWVLIKPLVLLAVFAVVFGWFIKVPSGQVPYPIFLFAGLIPWQFFVRSLSGAGASLIMNQHLITKVYFPRIILPLSAFASPLVELAVAVVVLAAMMWGYDVSPAGGLWQVPMFMLLASGTAFGAGLWLAALSARYRDVAHAQVFLAQMWFFATPVVYPSVLVPEKWQPLFWLNPMATVVEGIRWALLGAGQITAPMLIPAAMVTVLLVVSGAYYFSWMQRVFADTV